MEFGLLYDLGMESDTRTMVIDESSPILHVA